MTKRKNKLIRKSVNLDMILDCLKRNEYEHALKYSIDCMDKEARLKFLMSILENSKYRAYFQSLKNFKEIIQNYMEMKNDTILWNYLLYLQNLEKDHFNSIKIDILKSVIYKKANSHITVIDILDLDCFEFQDSRKWTSLICEICAINWPENKALKLLFG